MTHLTRRALVAGAAAGTALGALPAHAFEVETKFKPQQVRMKPGVEAGQIFILPRAHFLYYVDAPGQALRYGVGVGRAGLEFTGKAVIEVKKEWPTWRPTQEMIEREPDTYGRFKDNDYVQPGGPENPLGARALYLFQNGRDTFYRIHGTTAPQSIGRSVSNGCIRMLNEHVIDLYQRVPVGTPVTVL
ncbi:L,D-transpeptidase [Salipiger mucosus]|uniref:ErfK/YbiS/YcfS/YnhG family protein/Tat domain protein n=1 Tax=Salipiger mucosus DSM 16094 TaxID=1123237 RepID=S9QMY1_9RHOB|nr:L,D-transpeptidase [Salipiger mucosus]EPX82821.1 ErfK/YbiS/YcfS/YnhG family protein/Tat domain protein [Salipiger mucosus DSM 16094]